MPGPHADKSAAASPSDSSSIPTSALDNLAAALVSPASAAIAPKHPARIADYRILSELGKGGMGVVYLAEQQQPRRQVALKVVRLLSASERVLRRFELEAEVLGRLEHPGIASIYEAGTAETPDGVQPFFAMELVRGASLLDYAREKKLDRKARLALLAKICDAVQYAHQQGVIHRDLKPSNILVDATGQPKILDFGVARLTDADVNAATVHTETGQLVGTLPYMSPEQAAGDPRELDTRCDVYAMGIIAYELLTGRKPIELSGKSLIEAVRLIREQEPGRPSSIDRSLRGDVETILGKAMEKTKDRRYPTAAALAADIRRHLNYEPITARPPSAWYQLRMFARRNKALVAMLVSIVIGLAAITVVSVVLTIRATSAEQAIAAEQRATLAEKQRADTEAARARREASNQYIREAFAFMDRGDSPSALVSLTRALELDGDDPDRAWLNRLRIRAVIDRMPSLSPDTPFSQFPRTTWSRRDAMLVVNRPGRDDLLAMRTDDREPGSWAQLVDRTGKPLSARMEAEGAITAAVLSPDGSRIATSDRFGLVSLWDAATGRRLCDVVPAMSQSMALAFSPDGTRLAIAGGTVCVVCSVPEGKGLATIWKPELPELSVVLFSPDGRRVITGSAGVGDGGNALRFWDSTTGEPDATPAIVTGAPLAAAAISPDGRLVATATDDGALRVWDAVTGSPRTAPLQLPRPAVLLFRDDSRQLLASCHDRSVRLFDAETLTPAAAPLWHPAVAMPVAYERDMVLCGIGAPTTLYRWMLKPEPSMARLGHRGHVYSAAFSRDSQWIATGDTSGAFRLWSAATGRPVGVPLRSNQSVVQVAASNDARSLAVNRGSLAEVFEVMQVDATPATRPNATVISRGTDPMIGDPRGPRLLAGSRMTAFLAGPQSFESIALSADATRVLTRISEDRAVHIRDVATGAATMTFAHDAPVRDAQLSPDDQHVATACRDGMVRIWSVRTGELAIPAMAHGPSLRGVFFSPDGSRITSAGDDGSVVIWDARSGQPITRAIQHTGAVWKVSFDSTGRRVATASADRTARVWDATTGAPLAPPMRHADVARDVVFSPDDRLIATGSSDGTARVWDAAAAVPVTPPLPHAGFVQFVAFRPDGRALASGGADRFVRLWDLLPDPRPAAELRRVGELLACQRMDQTGGAVFLSQAEWQQRWMEQAAGDAGAKDGGAMGGTRATSTSATGAGGPANGNTPGVAPMGAAPAIRPAPGPLAFSLPPIIADIPWPIYDRSLDRFVREQLGESPSPQRRAEVAALLGELAEYELFAANFPEAAAVARRGLALDPAEARCGLVVAHRELHRGDAGRAADLYRRHAGATLKRDERTLTVAQAALLDLPALLDLGALDEHVTAIASLLRRLSPPPPSTAPAPRPDQGGD